MSSTFSVHTRSRGAVQVLDLEGELDAHTASQLEAAFQACCDERQHQIVANGRALAYISSAGLGVFMAFVENVREAGGDIKIAALQPNVYNVFDLLGFPMLFDIEDTEDAAVARFAGGGPGDASAASDASASDASASDASASGTSAGDAAPSSGTPAADVPASSPASASSGGEAG